MCDLTVTSWVPLVVQELLTILNHTNSLPVFTGVQVAQSLAFCVVFCRSLFVLFFCHCIVFFFVLWLLIIPLISSSFSCLERLLACCIDPIHLLFTCFSLRCTYFTWDRQVAANYSHSGWTLTNIHYIQI
jgi:hypothetical protein